MWHDDSVKWFRCAVTVVPAMLQTSSRHHQQFHLHLDTYWALMEVLYQLSLGHHQLLHLYDATEAEEQSVPDDPFGQLLYHILWDVVSLAIKQYSSVCFSFCSDNYQIMNICGMLPKNVGFGQGHIQRNNIHLFIDISVVCKWAQQD